MQSDSDQILSYVYSFIKSELGAEKLDYLEAIVQKLFNQENSH